MTSRVILLLLSLLAIDSSSSSSSGSSNVDKLTQLWKVLCSESSRDSRVRPAVADARAETNSESVLRYPLNQQPVYKDKADYRPRLTSNKAESQIYFIKLPPAPYSYVAGLGYISQPAVFSAASLAAAKAKPKAKPKPKPKPSQKPKPFLNLPIQFLTNGKPNKVYRWPANHLQDTRLINLNRVPYIFNGKPTGIYILKNKSKRKARLTDEYKKTVLLKQ